MYGFNGNINFYNANTNTSNANRTTSSTSIWDDLRRMKYDMDEVETQNEDEIEPSVSAFNALKKKWKGLKGKFQKQFDRFLSTGKNGVAPNTNFMDYKDMWDILKGGPQVMSTATFSSESQILTLVPETQQQPTEVPTEVLTEDIPSGEES
ncbi:hypothetical protein F4703DRAFT_1922694 [Phycomyces blakesleeanus]|uniref:Uncharacterized protein n=1 Tax=Phycomyces blakesleeanus (strain ATCC 8743b / DSM 1359 / FGSC 10004 / NBRC 33097 / NRRL 1555) TaxID=763407 RepID=A0A167QQZ9_PHYB8|nr:hypothetical protein PHYBLDRAFT_140115 [Phycomyces blakesleeanus NRRL 1555(-)]OAD80100.1 hypothetical protein PHYBLDRAFT_140115 [Phycomyces blakesleeanus NRRL 1555(-)]|eukprot:XP_018298140.1 hypothetical protein PHYBLDRAFT_140115 [Phycomyces blakesleeanus NRRL 1555(-)]